MLDRVRIAQELARLSASWEGDLARDFSRAAASRLAVVLRDVRVGKNVTDTLQCVAQGIIVAPQPHPYLVIGVDGSQIYPDRTFARGELAILNVAGLAISYGEQESVADFFSHPECLTRAVLPEHLVSFPFCPELIDLLRGARELEYGLERAQNCRQQAGGPHLLVFDGAMLQHGLMLKNTQLQRIFMERCAVMLVRVRECNQLVAWYTSAPQSRTLSTLVGGEGASDASLLAQHLAKWHTTPVFAVKQASGFGAVFGPEDACCFLYLSTGEEVVRLEMPRWVAQDAGRLALVCGVIRDQVEKGMGYPVVLTEAHRNAVVSELDRLAVLQMIEHGPLQRMQSIKMLRKQIVPV